MRFTTNALKLRRERENQKRRVPFKRLAAVETVVVPLVVLFLLSLSSLVLVVVVTDIFFFALDFKQPSSLFFFSHGMPPHVYNNKSFRLASSCALYIIRLIITRALRSTVVVARVVVMLSISTRHGEEWWFNFVRRSSRLEKLAGFFSQTLNPKRKEKYRNSTVIPKHTHTETRNNAFHTTRAKRNTRISRSKRTEEYFLPLFFLVYYQ